MNTYTWTFSTLDAFPSYEGLSDVVVSVRYTLMADDGDGHTASIGGQFTVTYDPEDPFIPFCDLTQAEVEGWANKCLDVPSLEQQLDEIIAQVINPPIVSLPPPWVSN